jgi:hypothetical protein
MKRIALFSIVIIAAFVGTACERHPAVKLPPHYQHKLHAHHDDGHAKDGHGAEAAKH